MRKISQGDDDSLRSQLLDEIYAGAAAGMPEMLLDEDKIRNGSKEEVEELSRRYGLR